MSLLEKAASALHIALGLALLGGLLYRRLWRICYAFGLYIAAVLLIETMILLAPGRFYVWPVYFSKEFLYGFLKLAVLVEITTLTYQSFPSARALVHLLLAGVGVMLVSFMTIGIGWTMEFPDLVREEVRRLAQGTSMAYLSAWALVLWYRIPLHRWHRAILRGLVPYLAVVAGARTATLAFGWDMRTYANLADAIVYALVLAYWAWEAWRKPPDEPPFLRTIQPWRARL